MHKLLWTSTTLVRHALVKAHIFLFPNDYGSIRSITYYIAYYFSIDILNQYYLVDKRPEQRPQIK